MNVYFSVLVSEMCLLKAYFLQEKRNGEVESRGERGEEKRVKENEIAASLVTPNSVVMKSKNSWHVSVYVKICPISETEFWSVYQLLTLGCLRVGVITLKVNSVSGPFRFYETEFCYIAMYMLASNSL